mgnify:CR=1 FL=1
MRKRRAEKRDVLADPIYNSKVVTKLINTIMKDGKRGLAQKIFYGAMDIVKEKTNQEPMDVLNKALEIVNGARQENYGSPESNFARIAAFWTLYLQRHITPADVAIMMVLMKTARLQNNIKHEDSWVDIAGYAANGVEVAGD